MSNYFIDFMICDFMEFLKKYPPKQKIEEQKEQTNNEQIKPS